MKVIGHIDADCFYVSCERIRDRCLMGKPVGVLGNQGACVIARSYEMRPFGVKVGMPIWQAKKLCPDGIYIKRDFEWYGLLSKRMQELLGKYSDTVEYYSIDESFLDFGSFSGDWLKLGRSIQEDVLENVGVPVSLGLSLTRTLAKTAADKNKPFGVTAVGMDELLEFLDSVDVTDVPGIGRRLFRRLEPYQVKTALDYVNLPRELVKRLVHKPGEELWYELQGKSLLPVRTERPPYKVISRGGSIWGHHKDPKYIWGFILRNLERFMDVIWYERMEVSGIILSLISYEGVERRAKFLFDDYVDDYLVILNGLKECFRRAFTRGETYSAVHIYSLSLRLTAGKQLSLFDVRNEKSIKLKNLKQELNQKFGLFTVRSAATTYAPEVFRDYTSNVEVCDIKGKFCF